jgi:hypothetical protein
VFKPAKLNFTQSFIYYSLISGIFMLILTTAGPVMAVRPFITDDARISSPGEIAIETSLRIDKERFQNLNVISFGIIKNLEGSFNFIDGFMREDKTKNILSIAGPGFQLKYLFTDGKTSSFPATGLAAGASPPFGWGSDSFANSSWSNYVYLAVTKFFFKDQEKLNLHINMGFNNSYEERRINTSWSWGVGVQMHLLNKLYLCTEIYQGDPYAITPGALYQVGLRYFLSSNIQMDMATGKGLYGDPMLGQYFSCGLRYVF